MLWRNAALAATPREMSPQRAVLGIALGRGFSAQSQGWGSLEWEQPLHPARLPWKSSEPQYLGNVLKLGIYRAERETETPKKGKDLSEAKVRVMFRSLPTVLF